MGGAILLTNQTRSKGEEMTQVPFIEHQQRMKLTSPAFHNGGMIPPQYTCDGANVNPPLSIEGVPEGTRVLALLMEDPDVPRTIRPDGLWVHWLFWNLDPATEEIPEATEPDAVHGLTTSGTITYVGPCPPDREHRYFFRLYALSEGLSLPEGATRDDFLRAIEGKVIAEAELMGRYDRLERREERLEHYSN